MADREYAIDLSQYIEARLFGERPHIRGRRIPIVVIAHTASANEHGVAELMYDFDLSEAEVLAAMLYYTEHKATLEAQEEAIHQEYKHFYED
ncbi:MAG: DUF433 domain-containing protein [Chloroflexi bacterium]|nr:DUF433 domain-containing protein [Chloroflexota bacterium]